MGRRRRGVCVDYGGGGRFYINGCHNGDNQRFRFFDATTTTTPPPPTPVPTLEPTPEPTTEPTAVPSEEREASLEPAFCPWDMTHGHGCHRHGNQKALCKDGNFSFRCIAEGHGERQQCPCSLPYMCAIPQCGDGRDYCCEKSCEKPKFGGDRPCKEGEPEAEPTGEPVVDVVPTPASPVATPSPTPLPKPCYAFARGVENVLVHAGIKVNGKSDDDKRNTCISFNRDRSSSDTAHFQKMGTWENEGAAAAIITLH